MKTRKVGEQKGDWLRVAPCLYRYTKNDVYYAVVRRAGKLIHKSLETDRLEIAKRELRAFLSDLETSAPDAHKVRLDEYMEGFLGGRTGAPKTLKRYQQIAAQIRSSWPGGTSQPLRDVDLSQCTRWLNQWNGKVATYNHARQWLFAFFEYAAANRKIQKSPLDKRVLKAMRRPRVIRNAPAPQEFEAMLTEIRAQQFTDHANDTGDVVEFMGRAGVGLAEVNGLRWQDIDFTSRSLKLFRVKTRAAFQIPGHLWIRGDISRRVLAG